MFGFRGFSELTLSYLPFWPFIFPSHLSYNLNHDNCELASLGFQPPVLHLEILVSTVYLQILMCKCDSLHKAFLESPAFLPPTVLLGLFSLTKPYAFAITTVMGSG